MKRILSTICILVTLVALALLPASAYASPDKKASGQMVFVGQSTVLNITQIGGYTVITDMLVGNSTGSMESTDAVFIRTLIIQADGQFDVTGEITCIATIQGKTGGITHRITGTGSLPDHVSGEWVILGGTGELAGVHGGGTFSGIPGEASDYSGKIYFKIK